MDHFSPALKYFYKYLKLTKQKFVFGQK